MNIGHIFSGVLSFFKGTVHEVKDGEAVKKIEAIANQIQQYLPQALTVAKMIDAVVPNRTVEEFTALAAKYQLHVTPEVLADPVQATALLENAGLKELQQVAGGVSNSTLKSALNLAVSFLRASK